MTVRNPGVSKKELWSWMMFDFANSSYSTLVLTVILSIFFTDTLTVGTAWEPYAILVWILAQSFSYIIAIVVMPYLANRADRLAHKKKILVFSSLACIICTALIAFVIYISSVQLQGASDKGFLSALAPYSVWFILILVLISNTFFSIGETFCAAFLPELAQKNAIGRVSSWGWGTGYLGGILSLFLCLYLAGFFNFTLPYQEYQFNAAAMLTCALFFLIATLPLMIWLKERTQVVAASAQTNLTFIQELQKAYEVCQDLPDFRNFLYCTVGYLSGVAVVISLAGVYTSKTLQFTTAESIQLIIFVNLTGIPGALFFGWFQDRFGHIVALACTLIIWMVTIIGVFFTSAEDKAIFWVLSAFIGVAMGASQSAGRAFTALFAPKERLAEFFAMWGLAVRIAWILGPIFVGILTWIEDGKIRYSFPTSVIFFAIGLFFLLRIRIDRAKEKVKELESLH